MQWYWLITNDNTVVNPFVSDEGGLDGIDEWMFGECRVIEAWSGNAWLQAASVANDGDPDDSLQNHLGLLVFSKRLQTTLTSAGIDRIQYLPIHVLRPNGVKCGEGFAIANVLDRVAALDLNHTVHSRFPDDYFLPERRGQLRSIRQVTLLREPLHARHVIRLTEYTTPVYVSEKFKKTFEDGGFTGLSFAPVNLS